MWDVRSWIAHARARGAPAIVAHGFSMGGFMTALLSSLERDLDAVVVGAPPADLGRVVAKEWRGAGRRHLRAHGLLGERLAAILRVVSPLAMTPLVAPDRRFIYAAIGDRAASPREAYELWEHWERPRVLWHHGSHLTLAGQPGVRRFVDAALLSSTQQD
jgi:hypothetical protein